MSPLFILQLIVQLVRDPNIVQYNDEYMITKRYIDHEFQDELFRHTKMLKEKKVITSEYDEDMNATLRPVDAVVKNKDHVLPKADPMFIPYTISEDRTGTTESVMATRLAALGARSERRFRTGRLHGL